MTFSSLMEKTFGAVATSLRIACQILSLVVCSWLSWLACLKSSQMVSLSMKHFTAEGDVVQDSHKHCACNLGGEVIRLAFAKSELFLAFHENNLLGPTPGVKLVCLEETKHAA